MTNLTIKTGITVTLNSNTITGNTYPVKDYIKTYLGGKWDANIKAWIVDTAKVDDLIQRGAIRVDDVAPVQTAKTAKIDNGWCNRCQSWCYGDCEAN